jgi:hypothetical protein
MTMIAFLVTEGRLAVDRGTVRNVTFTEKSVDRLVSDAEIVGQKCSVLRGEVSSRTKQKPK